MENDSTMDADCDTKFVGRVYRIWSPQTDLVYIGSTRTTLEHRFCTHKSEMRRWQLGIDKRYTSSYEIMKHCDAQIELIHEDYFGDTLQLREMEKYWVEKSNAVNKRRPVRTREEHVIDERKRIQTEEHRVQNLRNNKKWRQHNHERYREQQRRWREQNKEHLRAYYGTKVPCPFCGKVMQKNSLCLHKKRKHATSV
jgi:hypothetical protein